MVDHLTRMKTAPSPRLLDDQAVFHAIQSAEANTSGEIRVAVIGHATHNLEETARKEFIRLGMERTPMRNAVLVCVSPATQEVAVVADEAAVFRLGPGFGKEVAGTIGKAMRKGKLTEGVVDGVQRIGRQLALHFPPSRAERNDLPDQVIHH